MGIIKQPFGTIDGAEVSLYTLETASGLKMRVMDYGATVVSLHVADRHGRLGDVVLGYDSLQRYLSGGPYFGAVIGRFGNRIGGARFTLDGLEYCLAANNGPNHLHGGVKGFDKIIWTTEEVGKAGAIGLRFTHLSKNGDEGYPGNLQVAVIYWLTDANEFAIDYEAATDKATPVNLTHHSYFNLAGHGNGDILGHELTLFAERFTPTDSGLIPTGELRSVAGTPMDFRAPKRIGDDIDAGYEPLQLAGGYDHNWVLDNPGGELKLAAKVCEPESGRMMELLTTEPGVQFYAGNYLALTGKDGKLYPKRGGFCLETQHFPDSPNKPDFPNVILRPGEIYRSRTIHKFSCAG